MKLIDALSLGQDLIDFASDPENVIVSDDRGEWCFFCLVYYEEYGAVGVTVPHEEHCLHLRARESKATRG